MGFAIKAESRGGMRLLRGNEGNFTLEASMVFPLLFVALIAMLMLSMYAYLKVAAYQSASLASERTAFRWDNSSRDPVSGIAPTGSYDGLYWRMADNGALQTLFDFDASNGSGIGIAIGGKERSRSGGNDASTRGRSDTGETSDGEEGGTAGEVAGDSLPQRKMLAEAARVGTSFEGTMRYDGKIEKRLDTKLRQPLAIPLLDALLGHSEPRTASAASIADPVELIRNVDLALYYAGKFKSGGQSDGERDQARSILQGRQALGND